MTKLKQLNPTFPNGDCMRTVLACLLGYEKPDLIPNFTEMENYEENFVKNVYKWLDENNLTYVDKKWSVWELNPLYEDRKPCTST